MFCILPLSLGDRSLPTVFRRVRVLGPHSFWLDSGDSGELPGGHTWAMGAAPIHVETVPSGSLDDPFESLGKLRESMGNDVWDVALDRAIPLALFSFSYEAGASAIPIPVPPDDPLGVPLFWGAVYSAVLVGDSTTDRAWVCGISEESCRELLRAIDCEDTTPAGSFRLLEEPKADRSLQEYKAGVERVLAYIAAGDVYQANVARRYEARYAPESDEVTLFEQLRSRSEAPYAAFIDFGEQQILSASPECLLEWDRHGDVSSYPIKGTAGRGKTQEEDESAQRALRVDPKERAEHIMIVDLVRNDLGRVSDYGSVHVPDPWTLQTFPQVHHLISRVRGQLRAETTETDLWRAIFPGGSITGAPKIRACEVIAEVEGAQRGLYCGAIGFLDPRGGGCANIPIRTGVLTDGKVVFHVGGGIVADSDPGREAAETDVKALGWRKALDLRQ